MITKTQNNNLISGEGDEEKCETGSQCLREINPLLVWRTAIICVTIFINIKNGTNPVTKNISIGTCGIVLARIRVKITKKKRI